jgi:hypothetical protein
MRESLLCMTSRKFSPHLSLGVRNPRSRSPARGPAWGSDKYTLDGGVCASARAHADFCFRADVCTHSRGVSRPLLTSWGSFFALARVCRAPIAGAPVRRYVIMHFYVQELNGTRCNGRARACVRPRITLDPRNLLGGLSRPCARLQCANACSLLCITSSVNLHMRTHV